MSKFVEFTTPAGVKFTVGVAYITSFRSSEHMVGTMYGKTEVEYIGNAGYHTRSSYVAESYAQVKQMIAEANT